MPIRGHQSIISNLTISTSIEWFKHYRLNNGPAHVILVLITYVCTYHMCVYLSHVCVYISHVCVHITCVYLLQVCVLITCVCVLITCRRDDQEVRGKVLLNHIAFID